MKIILASHSSVAQSLLDAAQMFLGEQENAAAIGLFSGDSPADFEAALQELVDNRADGEECLILCDLLSGTPFNTASKISYRDDTIKVIYGMSLPAVVEALSCREEMSLAELSEDVVKTAQEGLGIGKY